MMTKTKIKKIASQSLKFKYHIIFIYNVVVVKRSSSEQTNYFKIKEMVGHVHKNVNMLSSLLLEHNL
jgi:hypothetical protein